MTRPMSRPILAALLVASVQCSASFWVLAHEQHAHQVGDGLAAGPSASYAFALPEPGSYDLPPIGPAAGGIVLDESGRPHDLSNFLHERITVLAFLYTRCGDACPTAALEMSLLQDMVAKDRRLDRRMRLISMSFDPDHDTPSVMAEYAAGWRSAAIDAPPWHFLTAPDRTALAPMLAAYGQAIASKPNSGAVGGPLHHIFRAFLIDPSGRIRNIYSLDFLDPELVINDIRTVVIDTERHDQLMPNAR